MVAILRGMKSGVAEFVIRLEELFKKKKHWISFYDKLEEAFRKYTNIDHSLRGRAALLGQYLPNPPQISVGSFRNHN
jgi:hypothetical protein